MKTAMQQLKEKIQALIGEMDGELNSYQSGYKQCLINIQNDIDLQMLAKEKYQITNAYDDGSDERHNNPVNGEQYYKETYEK
jgi:hypothetical protein